MARIQEALGNLGLSAKYYKTVLAEDSTHVEVGRQEGQGEMMMVVMMMMMI